MEDDRKFTYVLITPARNEQAFIEKTILSVISQTVLPKAWIVVSDGSTDHTDAIVMNYASQYPFIQFIRLNSDHHRNFSSKIMAFNEGYATLKHVDYDFIGNLDADVSFESRYYETILKKFQDNPKLGLAGGEISEFYNGKEHAYNSSAWHISGAIQLFRRQAFEDIGGYRPIEKGCVDAIAAIMIPMYGWQVQKYPDNKVMHYRRQGSARGVLYTRFHYGVLEYSLGYHPLYAMLKCIRRLREKPYIIGSITRLGGYMVAVIKNEPCIVPPEVKQFVRNEHLKRIKSLFVAIPRKLSPG